MALPLSLTRTLQAAPPAEAWRAVFDYAWQVCSPPIEGNVSSGISSREKTIRVADFFLTTAGWDLWEQYEKAVPKTADALAAWWGQRDDARAVLILDGLSLREVPWILEGARERGYDILQAHPTGAELPADTTSFAKALRLSSRSALQSDGAPAGWRLAGAHTETTDLPWADTADLITAHSSWVLWHYWPDKRAHALAAYGEGLSPLAKEVAEKLTDESFWRLVERLATGRRLVVTSDHGYAASGQFKDVSGADRVLELKARYKAGRFSSDLGEPGPWVPPLDLRLDSRHGAHSYVIGQRKWKAQGGYPTLTHGGLSVLELAVPFIELSRSAGA